MEPEIETGIRNNGFAGLRITDFGNGFDAEKVNKLIQGEAFKGMKDSSLKEIAGLGLAICYAMMKRSGGWTEAASLPGSGATFFVYLPFVFEKDNSLKKKFENTCNIMPNDIIL
ncbi:MAG: ATP-binding protein [Opitutaceae bacterium]|nr:ATP-binding protein [Cytophagales bacterium]